ncbi:hypothetical protein QCA50_017406 [Cerrena zonata]|uniref:Uncharacterized protein n=1 Tax=Cerrena zonata TaxID=2478898 RepID=A0AAW0FKF8_9APHY
MRFFHALLSFFFISFVVSIPVGLLEREDDVSIADLYKLFNSLDKRETISKRENVLLTQLFTSLNKSGQGVALTKQVTTSSLTQGSAIQIIIDYLKGANLTTILEAADNSGLALDIVLLTLTDYDVLPGIVKVIEGVFENSNSTSSSGGLVSSIIGGILDTLGLGSSSSSSNSSSSSSGGGLLSSLLGDLFGGDSSSNSTSSSSSSSGGGLLSSLIGDLFGGDSSSNSTSSSSSSSSGLLLDDLLGGGSSASTTSATSTSTSTGSFLDRLLGGLGGDDSSSSTTTRSRSTSTGLSLFDDLLGDIDGGDSSNSASTTSVASSGSTETDSADNYSVLQQIVADASSTATTAANTATNTATKAASTATNAVSSSTSTSSSGSLIDSLLSDLKKRDLNKRDVLDTIITEITSVAGTDETVNDVCTSLEKSGLGVSVVKQLFTDEDEYDFDIKLPSSNLT